MTPRSRSSMRLCFHDLTSTIKRHQIFDMNSISLSPVYVHESLNMCFHILTYFRAVCKQHLRDGVWIMSKNFAFDTLHFIDNVRIPLVNTSIRISLPKTFCLRKTWKVNFPGCRNWMLNAKKNFVTFALNQIFLFIYSMFDFLIFYRFLEW